MTTPVVVRLRWRSHVYGSEWVIKMITHRLDQLARASKRTKQTTQHVLTQLACTHDH